MSPTITCPGCQAELRIREEYIGKKLKCPRCSEVLTVPAVAEPEQIFEAQVIASSQAIPVEVLDGPQRTVEPTCRRCGERLRMDEDRCPRCRQWIDDAGPRARKPVNYKPCPKCGGEEPARVTWTPWGSFYGPALFNHVRCRECGFGYNGLTGRSNILPAILFTTIPAILIVTIIAALLYVLGVFRGPRF